MPTIRQTGINPQTEEKLAGTTTTKKRPRQSPNQPQQQQQHTNPPTPTPEFIPIRTPSALLARDPHHLSSTLQVSLDSIHKLRSSVAECVVLDPYIGHGGYVSEIISTVNKFCCRGVSNDDNEYQQQQQHSSNEGSLRPQAMVVGAITALDLYAHSLLMKRIYTSSNSSSSYNNNNNIGTGSISLDQLLLPDTTYSSFEDGSNLSSLFPFQFPTNDTKFDDDCYRNDNNANDNSCPSSSGGGIPFGQITEFSGRTSSGKTQLALSIAVHAVVINNLQVKYLIAGGGGGSSRKAISRRLYTLCTTLVKSQLMMQERYQNGSRPVNFDKEVKSMALKCLDRISIATVHDAYSLLGSLVQIENEEKQISINSSGAGSNCGTLLVIDSISGCLGHHIYSDLTLGASLSNQVFLTLRRMTRSLDGNFFDSGSNSSSSSSSSSSSLEKNVSTTEMTFQNPPRRFAVIVINGSVSKGVNDNDGMMTSYSSSSSSHKPAMGRYWQGGDIGLWLEPVEDDGQDDVSSLFYEGNNNVAGLSRSSEKVVTATLMWHYGKSVGTTTTTSSDVNQREEGVVVVEGQRYQVRFAIQAGGVVDV